MDRRNFCLRKFVSNSNLSDDTEKTQIGLYLARQYSINFEKLHCLRSELRCRVYESTGSEQFVPGHQASNQGSTADWPGKKKPRQLLSIRMRMFDYYRLRKFESIGRNNGHYLIVIKKSVSESFPGANVSHSVIL